MGVICDLILLIVLRWPLVLVRDSRRLWMSRGALPRFSIWPSAFQPSCEKPPVLISFSVGTLAATSPEAIMKPAGGLLSKKARDNLLARLPPTFCEAEEDLRGRALTDSRVAPRGRVVVEG